MLDADRRIWEPDDSCSPFLFESGVAGADLLMGRFTVPANSQAIIASIATQTSAQVQKSIQRIVIVRGRKDTKTDITETVNPRGALTGMNELDGTGALDIGNDTMGFIVGLGAMIRPCRIVLASGNYEVIHVGTNGLVFISIFGWIFRTPQ